MLPRHPADPHRARLSMLDTCLHKLEDLHERGETAVSAELASAIVQHVPSVRRGMPIADAIEHVMQVQEECLVARRGRSADDDEHPMLVLRGRSARARGEHSPLGETVEACLDEADARELTDRIRAAGQTAGSLGCLLVEAHDRRAWSALGYGTWADYVQTEFRLSRSRSYELLEHGRVLIAVRLATGMSGIPDISPYAAIQVKARLGEIVATIRERAAGMLPDEAGEMGRELIEDMRARLRDERRGSATAARSINVNGNNGHNNGRRPARSVEVVELAEALGVIARMPPVALVVAKISAGDLPLLDDLGAALRWLTEFAAATDGLTGPVRRES